MSKTIRRIFKISRSHVVTLPPEWVAKLKTPEVAIIYNNSLLIVPAERMEEIEKAVEKAMLEIIMQGE